MRVKCKYKSQSQTLIDRLNTFNRYKTLFVKFLAMRNKLCNDNSLLTARLFYVNSYTKSILSYFQRLDSLSAIVLDTSYPIPQLATVFM